MKLCLSFSCFIFISFIPGLQEKCTNSWHILKWFSFFHCFSCLKPYHSRSVLSPCDVFISDAPVKCPFHYVTRFQFIPYYFWLLVISITDICRVVLKLLFVSPVIHISLSRSHDIFSDRWIFTVTLFQVLSKKFLTRLIGQCLQMNFPELSQQLVCGMLLLLKVEPWCQYNLCLKVLISFLLILMVTSGNHWKNQCFYKYR